MNRLILIGNGFDIAHGLKTSYHDFVLDYLKGCIKKAFESERKYIDNKTWYEIYHDDELISITSGSRPNYQISNQSSLDYLLSRNLISEIIKELKEFQITITYKGQNFIKSLFNECIAKNWVDIESLYYEGLKKHYRAYILYKSGQNSDWQAIDRLKHLNNQLEFLKKKLEEYLINIEKGNNKTISTLTDTIYKDLNRDRTRERADQLLILNFNYTATPKRYLKDQGEIINIHGELNNEKNPIIFGYGDEVDKNYNEIEDLNENEFFKHIKSFDYFKTRNYQNLLAFIDGVNKAEHRRQFEIFIIGHSCGLSDRTMLSTIFEHKNCTSIKIFYHTIEDYRNKTYEISRHFNNKPSMRAKIVSLEESEQMPQYNK